MTLAQPPAGGASVQAKAQPAALTNRPLTVRADGLLLANVPSGVTSEPSFQMPTARERDAAIHILRKHGLPLTVPTANERLEPIPTTRAKSGHLGVVTHRNGRYEAWVHDRAAGS